MADLSGLTLVAWGVWGFFSKLASGYARPRQTLVFQAVGVATFGLVVLAAPGSPSFSANTDLVPQNGELSELSELSSELLR